MKIKTRDLILTALFAALTAIGAFLKVPTPISSFTLQFFFTCMAGVLLGAKLGTLSQAVYVLLGLVGLPIFTLGGGFSYVFQPTFGFLLGLIPAAAVIGWLTERNGCGIRSIVVACLAGLAVLYLIGLPYMHLILTLYLKYDWTLWQTVYKGMLIFLPWDALKIAVTAVLGSQLCPRLAKQYS
jgi:biotin transport system substrate-specific component